MDQDNKFFVYYYFLNRKHGWPPYPAACNARRWVWWRAAKDAGVDVGQAPMFDYSPIRQSIFRSGAKFEVMKWPELSDSPSEKDFWFVI